MRTLLQQVSAMVPRSATVLALTAILGVSACSGGDDDTGGSTDSGSTEDSGVTETSAHDWIVAEPSTVVFYPFDGSADDALGGFNGTVSGAVLTNDRNGVAESAYAFDGEATIDFGDVPLEEGSFTVSYWIRASTNLGDGGYLRHLSKRETCQYGTFFDFQWVPGESGMGAAGHEIRSSSVGTTSIGVSVAELPQDAWLHIAHVVDVESLMATVYVDGAMKASAAFSLQSEGVFSMDNDGSFGIAISPCIDSDATLVRFRGELDDIAIFQRALDASEVALISGE